jgi:hypothetical protein
MQPGVYCRVPGRPDPLGLVAADTHRVAMQIAQQAADPRAYQPEALWRDYVADAASFNALLSTLGGAGDTDDVEASHGYIGPELRQQISAVPLDTSLLRSTLRGYQVFGAQYAIHQERSTIGDEMGLGKTIEALAVFAHMSAHGQRRFMVVCLASVQINWLNEIEKHARLTAHSLHGRDREATPQTWLRRGGVAVTTFGTLPSLRCPEDADVAMLVVDEAHYAKNPDAKRSKAVGQAIEKAQRILFLTGTPMENRVEELRTLVGYLQPQLAARIDPSDALGGATAFRRAVAPVYLQRNQEDVLDVVGSRHRPRVPHRPGPHGPGARAARQGQRGRPDSGARGTQTAAVRRVRAQERRQGGQPALATASTTARPCSTRRASPSSAASSSPSNTAWGVMNEMNASSSGAVAVLAVLDPKHRDRTCYIVDPEDDSERATPCAVPAGEFLAQRLADTVRVLAQSTGEELHYGSRDRVRQLLLKGAAGRASELDFVALIHSDLSRARMASMPSTTSPRATSASASRSSVSAFGSLRMSRVSSIDSRSSYPITTAAGLPLRVMTVRSCSRSARSTKSDRLSRT